MKAKGCKHLQYDETKYADYCSIAGVSGGHAVWERKDTDPFLVQFCGLRGRLNHIQACTEKQHAQCNEYEDFEHDVIFRDNSI